MFKQVMQFKFQANGREYHFYGDNDSPTSDIKEIACQLIKLMIQIEDNAKAQALQQEQEKSEIKQEESIQEEVKQE